MQNTEQIVEVEDSPSTEDTTQGNLSSDDLLSFIEGSSEPEDSAPTETVAPDEEAETEDEGENVLLQSNEEKSDQDDITDDAESEEEVPKSVQKLLRQVSKLTARAKTAEEEYSNLEQKFKDLEKQTPEQSQKTQDINKIDTLEELEKLRQEALSAKKWARKNEGEAIAELNGQELTTEQIKEIRDNAEDYLDELIPDRLKFLQERHQSNVLAEQTFSFISNTESPEHELLQNINANDKFAIIDQLPNALYIKSLIVEGCKVVKDRDAKKVVQKVVQKPAKPNPPSAPISDVSPPQQTAKNHSKVLGKENVSEDQLVAFLSSQ